MSVPLVVLDTSTVLHLYRGKATGVALRAALEPMLAGNKPVLSIVTVAESLSFAQQRQWGAKSVAALEEQLSKCVVVDVKGRDVIENWARMDSWCVKNGKAVGENDLWIAATASFLDATLFSTDGDFRPLHPDFVRVAMFDGAGKPVALPANPPS